MEINKSNEDKFLHKKQISNPLTKSFKNQNKNEARHSNSIP